MLQSKIVLIRLNFKNEFVLLAAHSGFNDIKQYLIERFITDWNISLF